MEKKTQITMVKVYEYEFDDQIHSDYGGVAIEWKCPDCKETVSHIPGYNTECSCREWDVEININGTLDD